MPSLSLWLKLLYIRTMSSLATKAYLEDGKMHNKIILRSYCTYHLFCLVLNYCEAFKQKKIVVMVHFSHIFERYVYHLEKPPGIVSINVYCSH